MSIDDLVCHVDHELRANPARCAKTAALMGKELREIHRDVEHVPRAIEDDERSTRVRIVEREFAFGLVPGQQDSTRSADLDRLHVLCTAGVQRLTDRCANGNLIDAR